MKLFNWELSPSRLLSVRAHSHGALSLCFSTLSSLSPAECVARLLHSEFGPPHYGCSSSVLSAKSTQTAPETTAGSFSEDAHVPLVKVKRQQGNQQPNVPRDGTPWPYLRILHPKHGHDNPHQNFDNPRTQDLTFKHGDSDSHSLGHASQTLKQGKGDSHSIRYDGQPLGGSDFRGGSNSTNIPGNAISDTHTRVNQHSPSMNQPGSFRKTSQDIIRLLIDRANTQSWIALSKDIQDLKFEVQPKEVAWVLKVLKNPNTARQLFIWAAQRPGYTHDSTCYAIMVDLLVDLTDLSFLNDLLAEMEKKNIQLSVTTVNRLIGIYASADDIDKAEHYFLKLQELGMQPSAFTYKCMLQAFAKTGKCEKALEMYSVMQKEGETIDVVSYNILLDGLSRKGQAESAWKIFKEMKSRGNLGDVYTYTIVARAYGQAGMIGNALELLEEMVQNGVEPNQHTYNTILDALSKTEGKLDDAVKLFKRMSMTGIYPDAVACQSILKVLCKGRQVGMTCELALCLKDKGIRKEICEIFIKVLAKMGYLRDVCALYKIIKADSLPPSLATCLSMINALCRGAETTEAMIILKEVQDMAGGSVPLTTYNNMLAALRNNNQFQAAYELFKQIQCRGPMPDVVSYNIIIAGLTKLKQLPRAERLFEDMDRSGCMPNVITFNSLLHSFARVGDVSSVRKLLQMMHAKEVTPDIVTYNCTIECFGKAGKPKVVLKVFKEMQDKGVSPSFVTFNNILNTLANAGRTDEALSVFEQMKDQGFVPDAMTFTILGRVYDKDPHLDKKQLVEEIRKVGLVYELNI